MHLIVVDAQRFVKMPLSSFIVVVVVVMFIIFFIIVVMVIPFPFSLLVSMYLSGIVKFNLLN